MRQAPRLHRPGPARRHPAAAPVAAVLLLAVLLALVPARPARACSCGDPDLGPALAGAPDEALVVARRLDHDGGPDGELAILRTLAGGPVVGPVEARFDTGASCDPWLTGGGIAGLLLARDGDRWTTTTCGMVGVGQAFAAAEVAPEADPAAGPPTLLLAGELGGARVAAVDAAGRVSAFGLGEGEALGVAICPDGRTLVEVSAHDGTVALQRWGLPGLAADGPAVDLGEQRSHAAGVRCLDPTGQRATVVLPAYGEPGAVALVDGQDVERRPSPVQDVAAAGTTLAVLIGPGVVGEGSAETIGVVDEAGDLQALVSRAGTSFDRVAVSPSGTWIAAAGYPQDGAGDLVVVTAVDGSATAARPVPGFHQLGWVDDQTLWLRDEETSAFGVAPTGVELRDRELATVGTLEVGPTDELTWLPAGGVLRHGLGLPSVLRDDTVTQVQEVRLAGATAVAVLDAAAVLSEADPEVRDDATRAATVPPAGATDDGGAFLWTSLAVLAAVVAGSVIALLVAARR